MTTVAEHYTRVLAPIYPWVAGGVAHAVREGAADVASLLPGRGVAVDLGAGFGMHSIPLAQGGYRVVAIDSSPHLLRILAARSEALPIRRVVADLTTFPEWLDTPPGVIVCMGDTLTHLEHHDQVDQLIADVGDLLAPGGRFVATFRDYTTPTAGERRELLVRGDADGVLTCVVEPSGDRMLVRDLMHERYGDEWRLTSGSYFKLRIAPGAVRGMLERAGLEAECGPGPRGMVRVGGVKR